MTRQLTIRVDEETGLEIRRVADREGISLNRAVTKLLRRGAGLSEDSRAVDAIGSSLDHLAGTWSDREARQMEAIREDFERIDPEIWS